MARTQNRLKGTHLSTTRAGKYADGGNLWLQVRPAKRKDAAPFRSWIFIYKSPELGKDRMMGLGRAGPRDVTLSQARTLAAEMRAKLKRGLDPIIEREKAGAEKKANAGSHSFKAVAAALIESRKPSWKNPVHAAQWPRSLERFAYPLIGDLHVAEVTVDHVLQILQPLWKTGAAGRVETAVRLRGRIEMILDAAKARGLRSGDNPARWKGCLDALLPPPRKIRKPKHHPALNYKDLPRFMTDLCTRQGISPKALQFTILTAARTSEVTGARWAEIDLEKKVWTVPPERMKGRREGDPAHRVPLSNATRAILCTLPTEEGNPFVFLGGTAGEGLTNAAMLELTKEMAYPSTTPGKIAVPHGFRSTFKDWCSEETSHPNTVSEMALAHVIKDETEAAYRRGDMLERRRKLMTDWAGFAVSGMRDDRNVVSIGTAKAQPL